MVQHSDQPNGDDDDGQEEFEPGDDSSGEAGAGERVAKVLARAGVASRREVEGMIAEGRIALNGRILEAPGVKVAAGDVLTVDGEVVDAAEPTRLFRYHKPVGLLTTTNDPQGRPDVFSSLPDKLPRVISVGRLDLNTEGLLLLTNDGELARALELPSSGWIRRYRARAFGTVNQEKLDGLKEGVTIEGVRYGPIEARLDKAAEREGGSNVWISVAITEGKNREVRRVLEHLGLQVNRLIRIAYGPFQLGDLAVGGVAEVGPRVIREQLAGFVPDERLPQGGGGRLFTYEGEGGGRRPGGERKSDGERTRRAEGAGRPRGTSGPREERPERPVRKPGWAKAAPKPRHPGPGRPRPEGAPARTRAEGGRYGEGGQRGSAEERPARRFEGAYGERPRPSRSEGAGRSEQGRPDRPRGPARKPFGARNEEGDRPRAPRPRGERPGGSEGGYGRRETGERPFKPRRSEGGERSAPERRSDRPRPEGRGSYGKTDDARAGRPFRARGEGDAPREGRERSPRPAGDRPREPRPGGDDRPRGPRPGGDGPRGSGGAGKPRGGSGGGRPPGRPRTPR